jgi:hypothetical protein
MKTTTHTFKTFPEFSELTLADRDEWEELIADFPPISSISFAELMTWWSSLDNCRVAQLNGNIIISYWIPGEEESSGLCVIGTKKIDQTICEIFDYQQETNQRPHIVHVPEFVINQMSYPELFKFTPERSFDECVIPVTKNSDLSEMSFQKRSKVNRFLHASGANKVVFKTLDLSIESNQDLLFTHHKEWEHKGKLNNIAKHEKDYMYQLILNAENLGCENVCLYINGEMHSFLLYQESSIPGYVLISVSRFSYARPFLFEFCVYQYAQWFASRGIKFVNIDSDLDKMTLRIIKLSLGPVNFFRKYKVEPR